jgi:hypothetical protein
LTRYLGYALAAAFFGLDLVARQGREAASLSPSEEHRRVDAAHVRRHPDGDRDAYRHGERDVLEVDVDEAALVVVGASAPAAGARHGVRHGVAEGGRVAGRRAADGTGAELVREYRDIHAAHVGRDRHRHCDRHGNGEREVLHVHVDEPALVVVLGGRGHGRREHGERDRGDREQHTDGLDSWSYGIQNHVIDLFSFARCPTAGHNLTASLTAKLHGLVAPQVAETAVTDSGDSDQARSITRYQVPPPLTQAAPISRYGPSSSAW